MTNKKEPKLEKGIFTISLDFELIWGTVDLFGIESKFLRMNILVTGGAGFIGSHLVDGLVERGHRVRILDSLVGQVHGEAIPEFLNKDAEFIKADVCDADAVAKALDGIEVVYHEAAEVGVGQSMYEIVRYVKANDLERRFYWKK